MGGRTRLRRTGIIPGVMIQQFDSESGRRKEKEQGGKAEKGGRTGGWGSGA